MGVGKATGDDGVAEDPATRTLIAAVITPHRSLDPQAFRVMMALVSALAALLALRFIAFGFWPVGGFLALDVLGLYVAFRISYARARAFEEIRLTPIEISLRRVSHRGEAREWRLNPLWTKLVRETHEEFGLQRLTLESRGQRFVIAGELSPAERADFADELSDALGRAKRGLGA